jgi:hypothetical protein
MTPSPLAGRHAMSGTFASIDARLEPRTFAQVDAEANESVRAILRHSFTSRPATQEEIEQNRREERLSGFDLSPRSCL